MGHCKEVWNIRVMCAMSQVKIQPTTKAVFTPWAQDFYLWTCKASTVVFEIYLYKTFKSSEQLFDWKTNRARISISPLHINDGFCKHLSDTETDQKVWTATGAFSLCFVCLLARVVGEVFHRRASMTENVSLSNMNGVPIKILTFSLYILLLLYT